MRNITNKVQMGSRGGATTTVEGFTLIFLLPLADEYFKSFVQGSNELTCLV